MTRFASRWTLAVLVACVAGALCAQGLGRRIGALGGARPGRPGAAARAQAAAEAAASTEEILKEIPKGTNGVPTRLAFDQAPLEVLLYAYADVAGKILLPAPNLPKTQVTLKTFEDRELTKEQYLTAIEATLTMNGVVIEPFDKIFLRAFERKSVRTQGIRTAMEMPATNAVPEKGRVISQLIRLRHITAEEAQKALEGFKDPNGLFQVFERNNTILVTDTQENINRMLEVVRELDVANPVLEDVFVRQIQYAVATEIKTALETIVTESQKEGQQATSGPKTSGAPGFTSARSATPQPGRLLNLHNRPGLNKPEPAPATPNVTMMAQVSDADRGMIRGKVLILADDRSNKLIIITTKTNMDFFDKVIETLDVETTPEVNVEVIRLKYAESEDVASMLNDLIGNGSSSSQAKNNSNANAAKNGAANRNLTQTRAGGAATRPQTTNPTFSKTSASTLGELNKDNIKILADKRINGIVVMARKADMKAVKEVIEEMDVKLSQVLIETVIIEVSLGDNLQTGIDWVQRGRQKVTTRERMKDASGNELFWVLDDDGKPTTSTTTTDTGFAAFHSVSRMVRDGFYNNGHYMLGGGGGLGTSSLGGLMNVATAVGTNEAVVSAVNPIGGGLNYFLKSDKLNIAAIIQASKADNRTKYIASPIIMTVDNKEAIVEATEARQFLTGWTATSASSSGWGSGMPSPNYTAKDLGVKLTMTPKINPDGTIMLTVKQEYNQEGGKQSMMTPVGTTYENRQVSVPSTRTMQSDIVLDNRQTVVLGGLVESYKTDSETGIPILKDIPWIGKWLFGSVEQTENRKELLVFLTPYVLDDAEAAQVEAIRRKKTFSDPRPWEDNGWSASSLADPVSKKEQLRRLNDEWRKQDEERRNQKAIEEAREKRAKKLAEMDAAERRAWAEKHEKEILEERERFEGEQKDLREIIDAIREKHGEGVQADLEAREKTQK